MRVGNPDPYEAFTLLWWTEMYVRYTVLYNRDFRDQKLNRKWLERIEYTQNRIDNYG